MAMSTPVEIRIIVDARGNATVSTTQPGDSAASCAPETQLARRRMHGYGYGRGELLTDGENHVVRTIMAGHTTYQDIADNTRLSVKTIKTYMSRIYAKTQARNMVELVLMVAGIIPSPVIDFGGEKKVTR